MHPFEKGRGPIIRKFKTVEKLAHPGNRYDGERPVQSVLGHRRIQKIESLFPRGSEAPDRTVASALTDRLARST
jgi:hypothetical protein